MDMPDVGIGISYGALGLLMGLAATYLRVRFSGIKKTMEQVQLTPDPLRVEIRKAYATKEELSALEDRMDRRLTAAVSSIRDDVLTLRSDIHSNDERAEARASATHKRIDEVLRVCASRKVCK